MNIEGCVISGYLHGISAIPAGISKTADSTGRSNAIAMAGMVAAVTLICLPLLLAGAQGGHSFELNLTWGQGFAGQLADGILYPRWLPELNQGAGSPVFFFYGPVAYYIASLGFLGCAGCAPGLQLGIGEWLVVLLSAVTFYIFARGQARPGVSAVASVVYAVLPYHLYIDIMARQALGEAAAYIWLPLIFHFAARLPASGAIAGLAVSYALLIATHMPSTVLFSMFLAGFVCLRAWQDRSATALPALAAAIALGILLSGIYFVPAMFSQQYASLHVLWESYYRYDQWFPLDGAPSPNEALSDHILRIAILYSVFFLATWATAFRHATTFDRRTLVGWMAVFAGAWFIMTPPSLPLWHALPFLQKVQQPWRVVVLMDFAVAAVLLSALASLRAAPLGSRAMAGGAAVFLVMLSAVLSGAGGLVAWQVHDLPEYREKLRNSMQTGFDSPEYLPAWVGLGQEEAWRQLQPLPPVGASTGSARALNWAPRDLLVEIDAPEGAEITLRQFYYPGWQATDSLHHRPLALSPTPETGLIRFIAPPGRSQVQIKLAPLWQEKAGILCSLLGLLILLAVWLHSRSLLALGPWHDIFGHHANGLTDPPVPAEAT